jgi:hypothetical protein
MNEDKYIKGFNAGYLMQEKDPDLFKKLNENLSLKSEFIEGMKAGGEQYIKEATTKLKGSIGNDLDPDKTIPAKSPSKDKTHSKGLDK